MEFLPAIFLALFLVACIAKFLLMIAPARAVQVKAMPDPIAESKKSRARYVALEHEAMDHWEKLCDCPTPEMLASRRKQEELAAYTASRRTQYAATGTPWKPTYIGAGGDVTYMPPPQQGFREQVTRVCTSAADPARCFDYYLRASTSKNAAFVEYLRKDPFLHP